ncbi:hypothetical protein D1013_09175 [Euzebyella marina]|uniref:Uncharacterized protein n=1 Tax=Euzebyella marina TaxID=1761453 RepID=A0A3G2L5H0_9FLAO|nr:BfmA/BtgA family mobilization protein [Euzebyella marina]AYN67519.1 hypothetical protein D1013_09175 [Euzebyella marina]
MDRGYEKEAFTCLSIKKSIAKKYRRFCKTQGTSQSLTLMAMVEFFEHNGLSPQERLGETIASLKYLVKRRFNALIAILRSIEKEQTLPTMGMIQALFEQELENENEEWENEFDFIEKQLSEPENSKEPDLEMEVMVPKIRLDRLEEKHQELKEDFKYVLNQVRMFRNRFGKDYLKLEINPEALDKYRTKLEN